MTTNVDTTAARVVGEILAAVDSGDVDALCRRVTDDVRFQFGNAEVTTGISAFEAASRAFFQSIAAMTVHYERLDGQKLSLPCCNLFNTRDGRVHDYRVYMDINPVFAA